MVHRQFETFARMKPLDKQTVISINNSIAYNIYVEQSILEIFVPRNERAGQVNNQREAFKFKFQGIFDQDATQEEIYDKVVYNLCSNCLEGYNGTIFAYGQTGSGKTYTMSGADTWQERGVIPRAFSQIFDELESRQDCEFNIYVTFMEIYNENAYDLLDSRHAELPLEKWNKIQLYEDLNGNLHMKNLSIHQVYSEQDGIDLLMMGNFIRHVSSTPMNLASSRSHCIFTIAFEFRELNSEIMKTSKLHLVDLAGSERISKSQSYGKTLDEARNINLSLTYLEQVIVALHDRQKDVRTHIPYRNSLMTTILRDSLGGNCQTLLIATMNSDNSQLEETLSTARFARRCSRISAEVVVNEQVDVSLMLQRLQEENSRLKQQIGTRSQLQQSSQLSQKDTELCRQQVAIFLQEDFEPKLIINSSAQAFRCFQLFRETMLIKEEHYLAEIERLRAQIENLFSLNNR